MPPLTLAKQKKKDGAPRYLWVGMCLPSLKIIRNEIKALVAIYECGRQLWVAEALQKLLEQYDPDQKHKPHGVFDRLHKVFTVSEQVVEGDMPVAVQEIYVSC